MTRTRIGWMIALRQSSISRAFVGVALLVGTCLARAEVPFVIEQVSPHVWTAHSARTPRINATSTIIVGDAGLTVVESQSDPSLARQLIREIGTRISSKPIRTLIFTHAHLDHILGAQAFVERYPGIVLLAHRNTRAAVMAGGEEERRGWLSFIESSLAAMSPGDAQYRELKAYAAAVKGARILAPTQTFDDSMVLHDGLEISLKFVGFGHTEGDIVVAVPAERVLITGDLVHSLEPLFQSSHPREWVQTVKNIQAMDFDIFVGGHGEPLRDRRIIDQWMRYVASITTEIEAAKLRGQSLESARPGIETNLLQWLSVNGDGARIQRARESLMTEWIINPWDGAVRNSIETAWQKIGTEVKVE